MVAKQPRRIAVLTGSRSDYGLLYWTMRGIQEDSDLELILMVTGSHLSADFGQTENDIQDAGFTIAARIDALMSSDSGEGTAASMGQTTIKVAQELARLKPDLLLVLGDRTEILATVSAALPLLVPVAHIHGGESTEGAIDEGIRHAVTKLSHIHFTATEFYARRLLQMGEEPWRVHVSGAPALEHLHRGELLEKTVLERELGLDLSKPCLLVTQHSVTLSDDAAAGEIDKVLSAIEKSGLPAVITYPNADMGGRAIIEKINSFQERYPLAQVRVNLGSRLYMGLMRHVVALVGNSSSGIIEAASFGLPVVNVGDRQLGRVRGANVIDVTSDKESIYAGIQQAMNTNFRQMASKVSNPYDNGKASDIILPVLKEVQLGSTLIRKRLVDLPSTLQALKVGEKV